MQYFLSYFPLYIGMELVLGMGIINKLSGLYGIMSLFTGHPLDFMQWIFYISSIACVAFYAVGLSTVMKPKVRQYAAVVVVYSVDTLASQLFVLWFAAQWVYNEDVTVVQKPGQDYSKSASQGFEYSWMIFTTLVVSAARVYFNLVVLSFYKKVIKFNKNLGLAVPETEALKGWRDSMYTFEMWCYRLLAQL